MFKKLLAVLLALMLLGTASLSFAEDAAEPAETEAPAETVEPVLLVTVNGEEIKSDDDYLNDVLAYYLDYAANYGYDTSSEEMMASIRQYSLRYVIHTTLIRQKAAELGLDQFTDEEKAAMEAEAKAGWEEVVQTFVEQAGNITETSTDDEKAAARADAEAQLLSMGYDEAYYVSGFTKNQMENVMTERVQDYLTDGKAISDEEVQAYFDDLVKDDEETYSNDVASYEFYTQYYGQPSYYTPEGYRSVIHILLPVDEELMSTWKDLSARLEEQKEAEQAEATETEAPAEDAEPTEEPTATPEPVTEEMVRAAEQAILDSVQDKVNEIQEKLAAGASFEDLIKEYGTDPGMQDDATRAKGYSVHQDSILWDPAFTAAAMKLEKAGDIGEPFVSQHGVHILQYLKDIPGGAVELTDEMKEDFRGILLSELRTDALNTALEEWEKTADIAYTEAGESWKVPEEEPAAESSEETPAESTEDTPAQ